MTAEDWARSSFVRSLSWEITQAIRALAYPSKQLHHRAWLESVDRTGVSANLRLLLACNPASGWIPDFLAPPPRPGDVPLADELAEIALYPHEFVAADLQRSLDSHPTRARRSVLEPLVAEPAAALDRILIELEWAWTHLLAPFWAPVRELISADIAFRSREITRLGFGSALVQIHPSVTIDEGSVRVANTDALTLDLAGKGLALMPSAFVWPDVIVVHDQPWPMTLVYPARGIGELWSAPPVPPAALAGVVGKTRALLLADLAEPSTTTALAARHELSPAAVSTQLGRLHAAGLVSSQRIGKEVLYRRTRLAEGLLRGG
jgi:DNA-binding transcriptional ArsR family regulator